MIRYRLCLVCDRWVWVPYVPAIEGDARTNLNVGFVSPQKVQPKE